LPCFAVEKNVVYFSLEPAQSEGVVGKRVTGVAQSVDGLETLLHPLAHAPDETCTRFVELNGHQAYRIALVVSLPSFKAGKVTARATFVGGSGETMRKGLRIERHASRARSAARGRLLSVTTDQNRKQ